jgi:hypothetical protein
VISEIDKINLDIIVLSETKKSGFGEEKTGNYVHISSGVHKHQQTRIGDSILIKDKWKNMFLQQVNERIIKISINIYGQPTVIAGVYAIKDNATYEEKEYLFGKLSAILENTEPQYEVTLIGDFNSRVRNKDEDVVGHFGEEIINNNGSRWINAGREYKCIITNTRFQHKIIHKYTWENATRNISSVV